MKMTARPIARLTGAAPTQNYVDGMCDAESYARLAPLVAGQPYARWCRAPTQQQTAELVMQ